MVHFAAEIVDMFLSYLPPACASADDPAAEVNTTLQSCALVCRGWRPFATARLFRELTVFFSYSPFSPSRVAPNERKELGRWDRWELDFGRRPNTRTVASLEDFLEFISANDHIRRQIRRLFLRGFGPSRTERHVRPQLLTAIVDILPRLACLELSNVSVKPPARNVSVHTWPIVARALPQLTVKYDHDGCPTNYHSMSDALRLLNCFGHVDSLLLKPPKRSFKNAVNHPVMRIRVRHLSIDISEINTMDLPALPQLVLCMMENKDMLADTRSLSLKDTEDFVIAREQSLFCILTAATLPRLEAYTVMVSGAGRTAHPNLSTCTALRRLTLDLTLRKTAEVTCSQLSAFAAGLGALGLAPTTHRAFRALTLVLRVCDCTFLAGAEQSELCYADAAAFANWPTPRCARLLSANRLDAALVQFARDFRLAKVAVRCEVDTWVEMGSGTMNALVRCMFPRMDRAQLAEFEVAWVGSATARRRYY